MPREPAEGARHKHRRAMGFAPYSAFVHSDGYCVKKATRMSHAPCDHIDEDSHRNAGPDQTQECGLTLTAIPTQAIG